MDKYTYLIVGGGMTADAAVRGIREIDADGSIALISKEDHPPYNRPPLSKGLWTGMDENKIWRQTENLDVEFLLSQQVTKINPEEKAVSTSDHGHYTYEKLLIATGGSPTRLTEAPKDINYFRSYADYQWLRKQVEEVDSFVVIGGGFIGSEIAAALAKQEKAVTIVFPETGIGGRIFPEELARYLNDYYREHEVEVQPGEMVSKVEKSGDTFSVVLESGTVLPADSVVAGLGIRPHTALAESAGIEVDNGILVDEYCRTSVDDIYAAGDVANFYNPSLGERIRVEHEENANLQGQTAGVNMAGGEKKYEHLPLFYSDLFDMGYEAVGKTSSTLEVVTDWKDKFTEGVFYYLEGTRLKGVLLWNVWGQIDKARELIAQDREYSSEDVIGLI